MNREVGIPNKCTDLKGDKSSENIERSTNIIHYSYFLFLTYEREK